MDIYSLPQLVAYFHLSLVTFVIGGNVQPQQELYTPNYNVYHNSSTIARDLTSLAQKYSNFLQLDNSFVSRDEHSQLVLHLTNFSTEAHTIKRRILFSYGEHAREFFPIESLFHLLKNITQGTSSHVDTPAYQFSKTILSKIDLYIIALLNPDGRLFVEKSLNYCWRGTRTGVDLNRNFDWQFGGKGSSGDKNDEEYRGPYPFSEPETRVLRKLTETVMFDAFVSLHSGIRQIYVPFADSQSKLHELQPSNILPMLELARIMSTSTSKKYTYGLSYKLNDYTADGTIFDFMAGRRKIPFSFAIEMWGEGDHRKSKCFDLFNPHSTELWRAVSEVHPLYVTLFEYLIKWQDPHPAFGHAERIVYDEVSGMAYILLACLVILSVAGLYFQHHLPPCIRLRHRRIISLRTLSSTFATMSVVKNT